MMSVLNIIRIIIYVCVSCIYCKLLLLSPDLDNTVEREGCDDHLKISPGEITHEVGNGG